ncbi:Uncharacterized iron-regulated protein [Malonomonas rubra DSM 5091]|uniref:Uncharacterized iron-regulated protein n=1 Tax=Malonomonas rubra DSM 5091 TaxID=1122189 RepID=A0A1M6E9K6_MALRU|nr:ChaN family lipoprotein [Malonomonas rubra]SHI81968.1 Uncharacterized iron-regulated protein [Malonomonas rubra DSM 5091]
MRKQRLTLLLLLFLMTACSSHTPLGNPEAPYPPQRKPEIGDILHLPTGVYVDQQALYDNAERVQVVYVGETHDNPASHRLQLDILRHMAKTNPGKVSLGMEMFTPEQQPILDRWSAGELEEKEFLKQVKWFKNWRMNFALYRDLLTFCKEEGIPVLALNANKKLQHKVGRVPFEELSEDEKALLPEMDMNDPYQRAMAEAVFSDHNMGQNMLDGFVRVQTLWDETMAQNVAAYLRSVDKDHQIVVVAGGNHVRFGYGIPRRVFRRVPASYLLVGSHELRVAEGKEAVTMNVVSPDYPMPPYHFITYTEYELLENEGVKMGILLGDDKDGLLIEGVVPDSVAEKSGIKKDDVFIKMDDIDLEEPFDLIYELNRMKVGDKIEITLKRGEETLTLPVEFTEAKPEHSSMEMKHGKK